MRFAPLALSFVVGLGALCSGSAYAAERVAVVEFVANPPGLVTDLVLAAITDEARRAAVDVLPTSQFSVITKENQESVLRENGVDATKLCEAECEVDLARTIGAALLVTGSVSKIGAKMSLHMKLFHAERGQVLKIVRVSAEDEAALYELAYDEGQKLFRDGLGLSGAKPTVSAPVVIAPDPPRVTPPVPTARVTFRTEPRGARVVVDGAVVCASTPCEALVPRRPLVATFEAPDHDPLRADLTPIDGMVVQQTLALAAAEIVFGDYTALGPVTIDGNSVVLQSNLVRVPPGKHIVSVAASECLAGGTIEMDLMKGQRFDASALASPRLVAIPVVVTYDDEPLEGATISVDARAAVPVNGSSVDLPRCARTARVLHPGGIWEEQEFEDGEWPPESIVTEFEERDLFAESPGVRYWNYANLIASFPVLAFLAGYAAFAAVSLVVFFALVATVGPYAANSPAFLLPVFGTAIAVGALPVLLSPFGLVHAYLSMRRGNLPGTPSVGSLCVTCAPLWLWLWLDDEKQPIVPEVPPDLSHAGEE